MCCAHWVEILKHEMSEGKKKEKKKQHKMKTNDWKHIWLRLDFMIDVIFLFLHTLALVLNHEIP